jgi:hypothetical protein
MDSMSPSRTLVNTIKAVGAMVASASFGVRVKGDNCEPPESAR